MTLLLVVLTDWSINSTDRKEGGTDADFSLTPEQAAADLEGQALHRTVHRQIQGRRGGRYYRRERRGATSVNRWKTKVALRLVQGR
jgi:hypothetical protein